MSKAIRFGNMERCTIIGLLSFREKQRVKRGQRHSMYNWGVLLVTKGLIELEPVRDSSHRYCCCHQAFLGIAAAAVVLLFVTAAAATADG